MFEPGLEEDTELEEEEPVQQRLDLDIFHHF